ncbi:MAG TPA: hypothetical protein VMG12_30010 [Polyangiaceae bacterium]|nr:hypothetical protein [Polyangiaceae bacterium]
MTTSDAATVCINIGPSERRKRLVFGLCELAFTLGLLVYFITTDKPRALRLVLFVPWLFGAVGVAQALESTCVALAARNERNLDSGVEPMPDSERDAIRRRARKVYVESLAAAAALTLISMLLP